MSGIRFESSRVKERDRDAIRAARETVLEKAKLKAEWEERNREKGDNWMLPDLDDQGNYVITDKVSI